MTAKYERLHLSMEQRVGFTSKKMACLQAIIVELTLERDDSVAAAERLSFEVHRIPRLADKAKKLLERVSSLDTAERAKVSKGGKLPATRSKLKNGNVEAEVENVRVELGARNARVAVLKARTADLEKRLEQSSWQVHATESKYLPRYYETQTPKHQLASDGFCVEEMELRLTDASMDMLGNMDAHHAKSVKSENTVRELF